MSPRLLHLYGPFYINSYGLFIALGIIIVMLLGRKNQKYKEFNSTEQFLSLVTWSILGGILGGRILYLLTNLESIERPLQLIEFWNGGGSVLGSIIGILCILPWYAKKNNLSLAHLLDFIALYAPLLHSISRLGCFFAGCCFGKPSTMFFLSTVYSHPDSVAPLCIPLHPTQLYSSCALFFIFLILWYAQYYCTKPGQIITLYLVLASAERFFIDFIRGDQQFFTTIPYEQTLNIFSINQWIALAIFFASCVAFFHLSFKLRTHESF